MNEIKEFKLKKVCAIHHIEKIKTRAHELNNELDELRNKSGNIGGNLESLAAFVFTKIADLEIENEDLQIENEKLKPVIEKFKIENENLRREIEFIREHITRPGR